MRNLKKILAMVLALVMSLSLMATAGAADFKDASDINEKFGASVDVLSGLGVFNGYKEDGTFRPQGSITRAETAAIIYRIVTGDVKDEQVGIYADYNLFTDVPSTSWYAGYVNFCANAEYIKGIGNNKFDPQGQVTGYAALAMILRAIGYTANGGFTGPDWAVQTARTGEARKITKNINTGTLGQPASRETVAEILYQAIMVNMVDHNVLNTLNGDQGYTEKNTTLGQETFGLEKVSGVILANEWANLEGDDVLASGKTKMEITDITTGSNANTVFTLKVGDKLTLDAVAEDDMQGALDAVGLTYDAHIATKCSNLVASIDKSPINVVAYNGGEGVYTANETNNNLNNATWANIQKLADEENITLGSTVVGAEHETEYFVNYEQWWNIDYKSDIIIRYVVKEVGLEAAEDLGYITPAVKNSYIEYLNDLANITTPKKHNPQTVTVTGNPLADGKLGAGEGRTWIRTIQPGQPIVAMDREIMEDIFYTASRLQVGNDLYELGEVYAGTSQLDDKSDDMSWTAFQKEYFIVDENSKIFDTCEIGNSLRVIDNNNDGYAEYVLRIDYTQDKIVGTFKSAPVCNTKAFANYNEAHLYNPENVADMNTVVNYTEIDKKLYVWPAAVVTDSITNKNFQKITVTTASGDEYNQSGIQNETRMDENIMLMSQNTPYNMYMDVYGVNIRSYELAQGSKYALLTEMYPTSDRNSNYVQDTGAIAEVKIGEADVTEYPVNNRIAGTTTGNLFFNSYIWTWGSRNYSGADAWNNGLGVNGVIPTSWLYNANYLQPAVAHLGIGNVTTSKNLVASPAVWLGRTDNQPDPNYQPAAWYRYVAEAQVNPSLLDAAGNVDPTLAKASGSEIGVFDYDLTTAVKPVTAASDTNAQFSFTNVATYVDNDGTLTLGSASKLATNRANGAQLYRVSTAAAAESLVGIVADAADADKITVGLWGHGTETQLVEAYNRAHNNTAGQAWFDKYVGAAYQDGTGIYPIYETDYVQLDLTKGDKGEVLAPDYRVVKPGIRHFHIDDNYSKYYNANSNEYVDATVDTEFYIALPNEIMYRVGYADLPNIEVNKIRAAYAVANNTSADNDSRDYWVADVIVIEVDSLDYDYESISLAYYNPYVQDGFIRMVSSLNNEWRNLQPDYEDKAMMGLTPKGGSFVNTAWGDESWSANTADENNYWFWRLYRTELTAPGQLNVTSARKILSNYNTYGIYAGEVTRIEGLQTSAYVDVDTKNTGFVQTYAIDVDYGENGEVPFYTISGSAASYGRIYTANQINLTNTLRYSDVRNGDHLIWVYDKAQNRIAFVIDLDSRANGYSQPAWLLNLYNKIIADQTTGGTSSSTSIDALIKAAQELDGKITTALASDYPELRAMYDKLVAIADPSVLSGTQWSDLQTVMPSLATKTLTAGQKAALLAAQTKADEALKSAVVANTTTNTTAVSTALTALNTAINACTDLYGTSSGGTATPDKDLDSYIDKQGNLIDKSASTDAAFTNKSLVKNLVDAVKDVLDLANAKKAALDAVDAKVKGLDVTSDTNGLKTAYDNYVNGIKSCTAIAPIAPAVATTTDVEYYYKNGALVSGTLLDDLNDAIGDDALAGLQAKAVEAAEKLVPDGYLSLGDVQTKLSTLTSAINGCNDETVLNAIIAGNWTAVIATALQTPYDALIAEIEAQRPTAEANEEIDKQVVGYPGVPNNTAGLDDGKLSYELSYEAMGVSFDVDGDVTTVSLSKSALTKALAEPDGTQKLAIQTMKNGAGNIAVGISFKAPDGATQVRVKTPTYPSGYGINVTGGYAVIWYTIATGSDGDDGAYVPATIRNGGENEIELQFASGSSWDWTGSAVGGAISRTVNFVVTD